MVDISVYMQFVLFTDIHNSSNGIHEGSLKSHLKASKFFAHMTQKVIGGNVTTWHLSSSSKSYRVHTRKTTNLFQVTDTLFNSPGPKVHVNYCHHLVSVVCILFTFQTTSPKPLGRLEPNLAGMFLGWSSTKFLFFVPVGYSTWLPWPIICSDWLKFQRSSSPKLMN